MCALGNTLVAAANTIAGLGNVALCRRIESSVPATFNVVNNTDWVYFVGKYASSVRHPGVPIHINKKGDILVRPTYVESR